VTQTPLSARLVSDEAVGLLRTVHAGILDGSLRPRLDPGRHFCQRRLQGVA
jgi:hypothetical protein